MYVGRAFFDAAQCVFTLFAAEEEILAVHVKSHMNAVAQTMAGPHRQGRLEKSLETFFPIVFRGSRLLLFHRSTIPEPKRLTKQNS